MSEFSPIHWQNDRFQLLDQTKLPDKEVWVEITCLDDAFVAIRDMQVRGAPAIAVTAAYAVALAARSFDTQEPSQFLSGLAKAGEKLTAARPTAANLEWAVQRCLSEAAGSANVTQIADLITSLAIRIHDENILENQAIGAHGAATLPAAVGVLTHCNTGALATGGYGTAFGVIRAAWELGNRVPVYVTETRPWLQGSRLTMWEFARLDIPATLIVDSAAASLMRSGEIGAVVVGADRIVANGDTANKIGTYALALAASVHRLPFYVAAPTSTIDLSLAHGHAIQIEERSPEEVSSFQGKAVAPVGVRARNPVFDVTPAELITGIITERGVARAPLKPALRSMVETGVERHS